MAINFDFGTNRREVIAGASAAAALAGTIAAPSMVLAQATPAAQPAAAASPPPSAAVAAKAVESTRDVILRISREVWTNAEGLFVEVKSAAIHVRELKAAGFKVTTGTSNIPTAFLAEWNQGSGGPKIGFLPEYDALPGSATQPNRARRLGRPALKSGMAAGTICWAQGAPALPSR